MFILCFLCIRYIFKYFAWSNSFIRQQIHEVEWQLPWCIAGGPGDPGSIPGSERSPGEDGNPILTLKIPWTEEPGRLWSLRSQRVRHDWAWVLVYVHTPWTHSRSIITRFPLITWFWAEQWLQWICILKGCLRLPLCVEGSLHRMNKDSFNFLA